ncbi:MAG: hypothetical protein JWN34_3334 [Bryobacterales bacterium]|nr:hypothetical protein [Bryobacterales bacterium]
MRGTWFDEFREDVRADATTPPSHDPIAFAASLGFTPDEKQAAVLRAMADPEIKQGILNCTRQWGKSTTAAAGAVQRLVTRPGSLVVVASPSKKQSAELVRTAVGMLEKRRIRTVRDGVHQVSAVLPNGSRIVGLPGNEATSRGLASVSLLLIDEASRVPDAIYHAVRPMVVISQGDIWLLSTPWWAQGFFYEAWEHGGPGWARFSVKATECPRIPAAWLENERQQMIGSVFRREFMAEFVQDDLSAFDAEVVEAAMDEHAAPMEIDWAEFLKAREKQRF